MWASVLLLLKHSSDLVFLKAAEQGDAEAQLQVGEMYYKGQGVTQNYNTAAEWYEKAGKEGYTRLGNMYYFGQLRNSMYYMPKAIEFYGKVPKGEKAKNFRYAKAAEFYKKAAKHGDV
jgi:TPR repeat protein